MFAIKNIPHYFNTDHRVLQLLFYAEGCFLRAAGIICEYDPFHLGHRYQIGRVRQLLGPDTAVVCAMSGNFVQRGDFALLRKHARAEAAVRGGADLVLELPLPWAISSAEGFAAGGVGVLSGTGLVDTLAFGSECADADRIGRTADALLSDAFSAAMRAELAQGDSFAAARQRAAERLTGADAAILASPNDILGVEYVKALRRQGSAITPLALPRVGAAHDGGAGEHASASHIRGLLLGGEDAAPYLTPETAALYAGECAAGLIQMLISRKHHAKGFTEVHIIDRGADDSFSFPPCSDGRKQRPVEIRMLVHPLEARPVPVDMFPVLPVQFDKKTADRIIICFFVCLESHFFFPTLCCMHFLI